MQTNSPDRIVATHFRRDIRLTDDPIFAAITMRQSNRDFVNAGGYDGPDEDRLASESLTRVDTMLAETLPQTPEGALALLRVMRSEFMAMCDDDIGLFSKHEVFLLALMDNAISALAGGGNASVS